MQHDVFLGMGSNLEKPTEQLGLALTQIARIDGVVLEAASSLYGSAPVGYVDQPDFVNAVAKVSTTLAPRALLAALQDIERRHGRQRTFRNAPRTLDLDIVLFGRQTISENDLHVPHPRCHERAFVLLPLLELAPGCEIPGRGAARGWLEHCADQRIVRLGAFPDLAP